jgi:histone H3/H4
MAQEYSRAIARTVVGQLAELASYEAVQDSAAEILAELLLKYITELSASAHGYAELANRTAINVHDVLLGLDDLGTSVPELQTYLSSLSPVCCGDVDLEQVNRSWL